MNKKFFAALTSAAMLLSSTGTVFAEGFEEVPDLETGEIGNEETAVEEENSFAPGVNIPEQPNDPNKVNIKNTFTDSVVKKAVTDELETLGIKKNVVTKSELAKITSIDVSDAKNLNGVDLLTGVELFKAVGGSFEEANLSTMKKLETVILSENPALTSVVLPETQTLTTLEITGNKALTTIDLSKAMLLNSAELASNSLAAIDTSDNPYLTYLGVSGNDLNVLDTSRNYQLKEISCYSNGLYELRVPNSLVWLSADNNKLNSFDGSGLSKITFLGLSGNMLKTAKISKHKYDYLNLSFNHLATLDLKGVTGENISASNQVVYANVKDVAVDLKAYDAAFLKRNIAQTDDKYDIIGGTIDGKGIFKFNKNATDISYTYDTQGIVAKTETVPGQPVNPSNPSDPEAETSENSGTETPDTENTTPDNTDKQPTEVVTPTKVMMDVNIVKADLMNRLYNPNSGEHFYTKDIHEKDVLVDLGWQDEGIGWIAPTKGAPVYRLYNPNAGDHHYTKSANEKDTLVNVGWKYEGVGWYSVPDYSGVQSPAWDSIPVYREYNPNAKAAGAHNYTISEIENDALISVGWVEEGTAWRALK